MKSVISKSQVVNASAASGGVLPIKIGDMINAASYSMQSKDLVINFGDDCEILILKYLSQAKVPSLVSEIGRYMPREAIYTITRFGFNPSAQSGTSAGTVLFMEGSAVLRRIDGSRLDISEGVDIFQGDIIITDAASTLNIKFSDGFLLTMNPSSKITVDKYFFQPGSPHSGIIITALEGSILFDSGDIVKSGDEECIINTPVAILKVIGEVSGGWKIDDNGVYNFYVECQTEACNGRLEIKTLIGERNLYQPRIFIAVDSILKNPVQVTNLENPGITAISAGLDQVHDSLETITAIPDDIITAEAETMQESAGIEHEPQIQTVVAEPQQIEIEEELSEPLPELADEIIIENQREEQGDEEAGEQPQEDVIEDAGLEVPDFFNVSAIESTEAPEVIESEVVVVSETIHEITPDNVHDNGVTAVSVDDEVIEAANTEDNSDEQQIQYTEVAENNEVLLEEDELETGQETALPDSYNSSDISEDSDGEESAKEVEPEKDLPATPEYNDKIYHLRGANQPLEAYNSNAPDDKHGSAEKIVEIEGVDFNHLHLSKAGTDGCDLVMKIINGDTSATRFIVLKGFFPKEADSPRRQEI